jgi:hypothetical protein
MSAISHMTLLAAYGAYAQPANTVFLCHANGADASTTFTDVGPTGHTITANGNAQVDTAQKKFGSGSLLLDGTGDYLSVPDHADFEFGSGNFTIEAWVRFAAVTGTQCIATKFNTSNRSWAFEFEATGPQLQVRLSSDGSAIAATVAESWSPSINTWYHVAASRTGGNIYLFVDGVKLGTEDANSTNCFNGNASMLVGATNGGSSGFVNGWLDEVLIVKGTGLYNANFTPKTQPYADD